MAKLFAVHGDEGILCRAEHLSLPSEFYSAMHILVLMGFMALGRIRRSEGLRHVPPGELGKVVGLDRAPEVRTLRKKVEKMATSGTPDQWQRDLSKTWMEADPQKAGYLYLDGHVRVYHGTQANLPRRYVTRERLCLRGTTSKCHRHIRKLQVELGAAKPDLDGEAIQWRAERLEDIQRCMKEKAGLCLQLKSTPKKVTIGSLPEDERPTQLLPMEKILTDTVKMIAYRAETALVGLLRKHLKKEDEARALVRELLISSADILPNEKENTLTVRIHRMACPAHDKAISSLLADLTKAGFHHPQTGALIVYELT